MEFSKKWSDFFFYQSIYKVTATEEGRIRSGKCDSTRKLNQFAWMGARERRVSVWGFVFLAGQFAFNFIHVNTCASDAWLPFLVKWNSTTTKFISLWMLRENIILSFTYRNTIKKAVFDYHLYIKDKRIRFQDTSLIDGFTCPRQARLISGSTASPGNNR